LEHALALNGILSSALTALQTNTAALGVVSNNVANLNTQGYARRVVNEQALNVGGQLAGVDIADVQRVADKFLAQETLSAGSASAQYGAANDVFSQLNGILGKPGDGSALTTKLDNIFANLGSAALSPSQSASRVGVLNSFQDLANSVSSLSTSISGLQTQVDQQVSASIGSVNGLIKQIYDLNQQAATAKAAGDNASGTLDQRDLAAQNLAQLIGVRTSEQPDGKLTVMTQDGVNLVGDTYAQLTYAGGATNGSYGPINIANVNPATGQSIGPNQAFDAHLGSGKLKGLIDMRDGALSDLQQELGTFAQQTALAFNAQHNANAAFPPPTQLAGRNTGLLGGDALNFSGKTVIAVADNGGDLVSRVDVDFGAGTLSVDGGAAKSFGGTIGGFVSALNNALGANGSASFADGALTLSGKSGNGVVVQDDATTPSARGGVGFSQFFGLNDLFHTGAPSIVTTGLSAGDASGFAAGGKMDFTLKGPNGEIAKQASVTIAAGMSIGNVVTAMNTAFGGQASFALGADGSLTMNNSAANAGYQLNVTNDTTARGTTGMSFTQLFDLGISQESAPAMNFSLNPAIAASPQRLAFAAPSITASSVAGDAIVSHGDSRGILALQNLSSVRQSFGQVGAIGAQAATLNDYAGAFYQDVATRSQDAGTNNTAQSDRLTEAQSRQSANSGVNLDEELSNMMTYQQAYSAGARMLDVAQKLYDTLLQVQ
jgi:flagellar hook-associated protein 1